MPELIARSGSGTLAIEHEHALRVAQLPDHHRDPFDRLLVAQAQALRIPLVSADPEFERYDVEVLRPLSQTTVQVSEPASRAARSPSVAAPPAASTASSTWSRTRSS